MNVSVPESMRDWVQSRIESGEYASVSDYVRDLIRRDQNALARQLKVEDIRRTIEESRAMGRTLTADEVFARIEDKLRRMAD
jgi:antitoxin ParD1/3/4